ncbi:glycosyltransferase [Haladaptatus cibarius]|uniref:glycosyltransferase n=1 Tax=Haladaptatus cibarius TaxID=453847 RepID=UPI00067952CA
MSDIDSTSQDSKSDASPSVAILHDRFPQIGGGEKFAIEAARTLNAPIYTMYVYPGTEIPDDVRVIPIKQEKYARGLSKHLLAWKNEGSNPFETLSVAIDMTDAHPDLTQYDVVLESAPLSKHYVPTVDQTIIHYPHSPPRWLYDLYRDRMESFDYPGVRFALKTYAKWWRALDKEANDFVDTFVANSELIRDRIQRYYHRDAKVVYPPVTGDWRNEGDDGYFVTWSRLAPEKRMPLLAEAFTELDERLVIAGDGAEREKLERIARGHDNIEVRGFVEDIESLVARSTGVVYAPVQEDFGLVGAEALMAGKPLLGVNEGFTKYQVEEGVTGELFESTVESIQETVQAFDPSNYDSDTIQERAERYSYESFQSGLWNAVCQTDEED